MAHSLEVRTAYLDTDVVDVRRRPAGAREDQAGRHEASAQAGGAAVFSRGDGQPAEGRVPDAGDAVVPERSAGLRPRDAQPRSTRQPRLLPAGARRSRSSIACTSPAPTTRTSTRCWRSSCSRSGTSCTWHERRRDEENAGRPAARISAVARVLRSDAPLRRLRLLRRCAVRQARVAEPQPDQVAGRAALADRAGAASRQGAAADPRHAHRQQDGLGAQARRQRSGSTMPRRRT